MKVTIEIRNRVAGKYNVPCSSKIALTEERITVQEYLNNLYFSQKIDGTIYLKSLKAAARMIRKNNELGLSELLKKVIG